MLGAMLRGGAILSGGLPKSLNIISSVHETAVKIEAFRLMKLFKKEIRQGTPGGRKFTAASLISQTRKHSKKILNKLALGVRYQVIKNPFGIKFGWVGPRVSASWKRLAAMHQEGFTREITEEQRRYFRIVGGQRSRGKWVKGAGRSGAAHFEVDKRFRVFFLRSSTMFFKTPARPMRDPFYRAYKHEAVRNIRRNFRAKMIGKRI